MSMLPLAFLRPCRRKILCGFAKGHRFRLPNARSFARPSRNNNLAAPEKAEVQREQAWTEQRHSYPENNENSGRKRAL
jgi:hypothetical protein